LASQPMQARQAINSLDIDITTAATIATICRPLIDIFLSKEGDTPVTTGASDSCNRTFVLEYETGVI
jgi:hypothetical protein